MDALSGEVYAEKADFKDAENIVEGAKKTSAASAKAYTEWCKNFPHRNQETLQVYVSTIENSVIDYYKK